MRRAQLQCCRKSQEGFLEELAFQWVLETGRGPQEGDAWAEGSMGGMQGPAEGLVGLVFLRMRSRAR